MELKEDILQPHQAESDWTPLRVRARGLRDGVVVDVDDAVEHRHRHAHRLAELMEVKAGRTVGIERDVAGEVDRTQVADSRLVFRSHLGDLGAEVGEVNDVAWFAGLVALQVRGVLEGHPTVPGFGQRPHHTQIEVARLDLPVVELIGFRFLVCAGEGFAEEIGQLRHVLRIEERPHAVGFHALHEEIGNPVGKVETVGAASVVTGVFTEFEEGLDVCVPGLEVDAARTLALAALIDRCNGAVERAQPRDDAVGETVGGADQRTLAADAMKRESDAAGEFRQQRDVLIRVVDAVERVQRRVVQVARGHLRVFGAGVEERW